MYVTDDYYYVPRHKLFIVCDRICQQNCFNKKTKPSECEHRHSKFVKVKHFHGDKNDRG